MSQSLLKITVWPFQRFLASSVSTALEDENMTSIIAQWKDSVTEFGVARIETFPSPDNYRELLELLIALLVARLTVESISDICEQFTVSFGLPQPFTQRICGYSTNSMNHATMILQITEVMWSLISRTIQQHLISRTNWEASHIANK